MEKKRERERNERDAREAKETRGREQRFEYSVRKCWKIDIIKLK